MDELVTWQWLCWWKKGRREETEDLSKNKRTYRHWQTWKECRIWKSPLFSSSALELPFHSLRLFQGIEDAWTGRQMPSGLMRNTEACAGRPHWDVDAPSVPHRRVNIPTPLVKVGACIAAAKQKRVDERRPPRVKTFANRVLPERHKRWAPWTGDSQLAVYRQAFWDYNQFNLCASFGYMG